ncbi:hypothetical protein [Spirillospora sp. CA-294931]|uniref:hypothetical protein n=1 Tax=Spirillospora sp. CA-294931 TaxID=3240042 RepID=UPI003D927C35
MTGNQGTGSERYEEASRAAVAWLRARLGPDGSYGPEADDLACHYKSPQLLAAAGHPSDARRVLDHIERRFMRSNGDFATEGTVKSANPVFDEFRAYPNAWIAIAAHRMGRFGTAARAMGHLVRYHNLGNGGFRTNLASGTDSLTTAHLGLASLYTGQVERAAAAGVHLAQLLAVQPDLKAGFYVRLDHRGRPVTEFPGEAAPVHVVSATEPEQAYFMIGYPIAFLTLLAELTEDATCLETAHGYLDFVLSSGGNPRSCHHAHKVGWGAALYARTTGDREAAGLASDIAGHLLATQSAEGHWLPGEAPHTTYDQTAETALWLLEISASLGTDGRF